MPKYAIASINSLRNVSDCEQTMLVFFLHDAGKTSIISSGMQDL